MCNECEALARRLDEAIKERNAERARAENLIRINGILRDRPDLGDRAKKVEALVKELEEAKSGRDTYRRLYYGLDKELQRKRSQSSDS